ncbi:MAG: hypothetical protein KC910_13445 [Candidatus Eremiobacteraeota bacterium]|nr:hypothetical protein [Candidatus Eremiobacteraeota bacterium]
MSTATRSSLLVVLLMAAALARDPFIEVTGVKVVDFPDPVSAEYDGPADLRVEVIDGVARAILSNPGDEPIYYLVESRGQTPPPPGFLYIEPRTVRGEPLNGPVTCGGTRVYGQACLGAERSLTVKLFSRPWDKPPPSRIEVIVWQDGVARRLRSAPFTVDPER